MTKVGRTIEFYALPHMGADAFALAIGHELDEAYDLKNKEVRALRKDLEKFIRQTGTAERRAMLVQERKKK
jgi:hypothetical protein